MPYRWLRAEAEAGRVPALNAGGRLLARIELVEAELSRRAEAKGVINAR